MSTIGALSAGGGFRPDPANTVWADASATAFGAAAMLSGLHRSDTAISESTLSQPAMKTGAATFEDSPRSRSSTADLADSIAKLNEARDAFRKEASLTPAQRARRDVLEAMELTEDAIKAMPPEQQKDIEQKIAAEVARRLRERSN